MRSPRAFAIAFCGECVLLDRLCLYLGLNCLDLVLDHCSAHVCGVAGAPACEWESGTDDRLHPGVPPNACIRMGWGPRTGS